MLRPVEVVDPSNGQLAHWAGLNLSRAWMLRALADTLPADHRLVPGMRSGAAAHEGAGLATADHDDYMISHWVPTFAVRLLIPTIEARSAPEHSTLPRSVAKPTDLVTSNGDLSSVYDFFTLTVRSGRGVVRWWADPVVRHPLGAPPDPSSFGCRLRVHEEGMGTSMSTLSTTGPTITAPNGSRRFVNCCVPSGSSARC